MLIEALQNQVDIFRPVKPATPSGMVTYSKAVVSGIKLAQTSSGFTVSNSGTTQKRSATLYFNIGKSAETPLLSPLFKAGDIVAECSNSPTPPDERLVVQDVVKHTFKGFLHHYEVIVC